MKKNNIREFKSKDEQRYGIDNESKEIKCKNCYFASKASGDLIGVWHGQCRRFPPQVIIVNNVPVITWPIISDSPDMFCHEFKEESYEAKNA